MVELENRNANGRPNGVPATPSTAGTHDAKAIGRDIQREGKHQAEKAKEQLRSFAEMGKERVAERLDHVARALRTTGENLRGDEDDADLSQYAEAVGDRVESVARYLKEHEAMDLAEGIERIARRQPLLFLGGAFVAGLALGRFFKSSPVEVPIEEGYARGGYDVDYGYPEAQPAVVAAPVTSVGEIAQPEPYTPPSGTFGGPTGNDGHSS